MGETELTGKQLEDEKAKVKKTRLFKMHVKTLVGVYWLLLRCKNFRRETNDQRKKDYFIRLLKENCCLKIFTGN